MDRIKVKIITSNKEKEYYSYLHDGKLQNYNDVKMWQDLGYKDMISLYNMAHKSMVGRDDAIFKDDILQVLLWDTDMDITDSVF